MQYRKHRYFLASIDIFRSDLGMAGIEYLVSYRPILKLVAAKAR